MRLRYDEDFVEAAVLLCATGRRKGASPMLMARFNRERDKLYDILDPDDRNAAFFRLHLDWFREWGLERHLTSPLKEFPLLTEALEILAFRKSRGKADDGAELYVNESGERNGVVAIQPERLERDAELLAFLRHEFTHLHDMVDPAFAYHPELMVLSPSLGSQRLARERYRLLWDVSIDGRLTRSGHGTVASKDQLWSEFTGAFAFWGEARHREVFGFLWNNPHLTHHDLEELVCDPRQQQTARGPSPGAPCPLCGFPTFAWADQARLTNKMVIAIESEFSHWAPAHGVCARCSEIYRIKGLQIPLTV